MPNLVDPMHHARSRHRFSLLPTVAKVHHEFEIRASLGLPEFPLLRQSSKGLSSGNESCFIGQDF
jgi:hypothetical protein